MREILFRGKTNKGEWLFGDLINEGYDFETAIRKVYEHNGMKHSSLIAVIPETVGQYTGLTDKNGTKIFEGDIVSFAGDLDFIDGKFIVVFDKYCRWMIVADKGYYLLARNNKDVEVIGNIHDNPELLGGACNG